MGVLGVQPPSRSASASPTASRLTLRDRARHRRRPGAGKHPRALGPGITGDSVEDQLLLARKGDRPLEGAGGHAAYSGGGVGEAFDGERATRRPAQPRCRARSREAVRKACSRRAPSAAERRRRGACLPPLSGACPARARRSAGRSRSPALARRGAGRGAIVAAGHPAGPPARRARLPPARAPETRWPCCSTSPRCPSSAAVGVCAITHVCPVCIRSRRPEAMQARCWHRHV